jgi:hypothetical protein
MAHPRYSISELESMLKQAYYEAEDEKGNIAAVNECATETRGIYGSSPAQPRRSTPKEESEKNFEHHRDQADKSGRAVKFFQINPAFSDFVELVRSGAIQF